MMTKLPPAAQWCIVAAASALLAMGLHAARFPAPLLFGPMVAGILMGTNGGTIRLPRPAFLAAQSAIGCLIATTITPPIVASFVRSWPIVLGVVFASVGVSSVLGWLLTRWGGLPGTTGVWGSSPGAASAMVVMAEAFGADVRLVAFMQYLRVVCVVLVASVIARFWVPFPGAVTQEIVWFPHVHWPSLAGTVAIAGVGAFAGRLLRIPGGALLVPLVTGAVLHWSGGVSIELPEWLLAAVYASIGWKIGLGFTLEVLQYASRALPKILLSIAVLIAFCGGLAFVLTRVFGVDPLTAYLATSPGGIDSVAIIAASSKVDLPFVMAFQTVRLFIVILIGPTFAGIVARRMLGKIESC
ncbi:MAG TPA: AbrB family transcriptional regulator [Terrimicrobiaceae bacterium]